MIAVSEAARNIVCSGGTPIGITNCLNFGNPYDPEVYYQFVHAIKGMGEACKKFDTPVTGGNVSFYNQHPEGAVYPTPTIGMVGVLDSLENKMTLGFKTAGDLIYLVGRSSNDINSSEYLHKLCGIEHSPAPYFDLEDEWAMQQQVALLIRNKLINAAHDVSEGGLFVALIESAFVSGLGCAVQQTDAAIRPDAFWFGESQGRVVVTVPAALQSAFEHAFDHVDVPYSLIGSVDGTDISVNDENWGSVLDWKTAYDEKIGGMMKQ